MTKETAVLQLTQKGGDLIVSTLAKIESLKTRISRKTKVGIEKGIRHLTESGGAQADKDAAAQAAKEESRLAANAKGAANELLGLTKTAASLDPSTMMQGVAGSLGRAANAINIPGMGVVSAAADLAGAGIAAAGNALNAVKSSLPHAIDTLEKEAKLAHFGGGATDSSQYSLAEKAALIDGAVNKFGKIGDKFGNQIKKLIEAGVAPEQVAAISQGRFSASGTDKGYFFQKIADSFGSLPPSMGQEMQAQLMQAFGASELMQDNAKEQRARVARMDASDRAASKEIAMANGVEGLNSSMNTLRGTMVRAGADLSGMVASFGSAINKAIPEIAAAIKSGKSAASDWRSYIPFSGGIMHEAHQKAKQGK